MTILDRSIELQKTAGSAQPYLTADPFELWSQLTAGEMCPVQQGLAYPEPPLLKAGLADFTYTQPRVAHIYEDGNVKEEEIVKVRSMLLLTPEGEHFMSTLKQHVVEHGLGIDGKQLAGWRVAAPWMRIMRKWSVDEVPQLLFNVLGLPFKTDSSLPLMKLSLAGSARPTSHADICMIGDNSNDNFNRALETVGHQLEIGTRRDVIWQLSRDFQVGAASYTTAYGNRQMDTEQRSIEWILGNLRWGEIQRLSPVKRRAAKMAILLRTAKHVAWRTDAI